MSEEKTVVNQKDSFVFKYSDVVKIHWKIQAIVHFTLSLPIAFLTVYSWGLTLPALFRLTLAYIDLYFLIYFPLYWFLPYITLYPVRKELEKFNHHKQLSNSELSHLISYLMNCPIKIAFLIAFIEFSAFMIGALMWKTGLFVPEFQAILTIALLETFILGIVVAINISFLNLIMIESHMRNMVEHITHRYPHAFELSIPIRKISMYTKVFFLILLTTIAGEISIFIFFTTYILSTNPQKFMENAMFVGWVILINFLYIFILAPIVAGNFTTPIHKLVDCLREVAQGKVDNRIRFITNDETIDIIRGSNVMIEKLEKNRDMIEGEKNKLSTVLFGVIDGVIALNARKKIILLNKAAEEITGWTQKEALNQDIDTVLTLRNEENSIITSQLYCPSLVDTKGLLQRYSYANIKLKTKNEKEKYITITCSTIQKASTETAYIITFHDTSEERDLENMKLDFVSMAAHELRTPITVIKGYMQVFLEENKNKLDSDQATLLSRVYYTSQQLSTLVENLLNISKIERNSMSLNIQKIEWRTFIEETIESMRYMAQEKQIQFEAIVPASFHAFIDGDKIRIQEILENLITNAIFYTPTGGSVRIVIEELPDAVVTHIQDTGIGIPENAIPYLFTKFFRVSSKLMASSKGSGIGLYLSKAIVEMHNGKIWVQSKLREGSTFSFSLPKQQKRS